MADLFDNLSPEEQKFIKAYEHAFSNDKVRSEDELIFDKLYLLSRARKHTRVNKQPITSEFIDKEIQELKEAPNDYTAYHYFSALSKIVRNLYEAKKTASYKHTTYGLWTSENNRRPTPEGHSFMDYLEKDTHNGLLKIHKKEASSWIFRIPEGVKTTHSNHRYAINAQPSIELIKKLSEYAIKHQMYFKTCNPQVWEDRIDSIVIYSPHPSNESESNELKQIVQPYIRRECPQRTNDMDGTLIAEGLIIAKESSLAECLNLKRKLNSINPALSEVLEREFGKENGQTIPLSLGYFTVFQNILDSYQAEKQRLSTSQQITSQQKTSLNDLFQRGITVTLKPGSRLTFAPDIETLQMKKDENNVLQISGISKNAKQQIHFDIRDEVVHFELQTEEFSRSYTNKYQNKFTYRNLKFPSTERHNDDNFGQKVCRELSLIVDKIKKQYKQKTSNKPNQLRLNEKTK